MSSTNYMGAQPTQLCLALCSPMDCSLPGSCFHGIFQARILKWVTMPSSRRSSQPRDQTPHLLCLLHCQAGSLPLVPPGKPLWMICVCVYVCVCAHMHTLICVQLFATPWTIACQAPMSMGFLRHKYQNEFLFPFPGDPSHPGIKPTSFSSSALAGRFFATAPWGKSLEWEGWISKTGLKVRHELSIHMKFY